MPCHTRMKTLQQGLQWLLLAQFGFFLAMALEPGFLDFDNLPDTNFTCVGKVIGGYYADLETNCQMFHVCTIGQLDEPMDIRFLCLNGTVFDQETRVCERIDEVDCSKSEQFYSLNLELYGNTQPPILEEEVSKEEEDVDELKPLSTSPKTSTSKPSAATKPTFSPYQTTTPSPTLTNRPAISSNNRFSHGDRPDIRFNPEEINISLHPNAPPDITRSQIPISFQHQTLNNNEANTKVTITTHSDYHNDKPHQVSLLSIRNSSKENSDIKYAEESRNREPSRSIATPPKSVVNYDLTHEDNSNSKEYDYSYRQTDDSLDYIHTDTPPHPYHYQLHQQDSHQQSSSVHSHPYLAYIQSSTSKRTPKQQNFPSSTTYRTFPRATTTTQPPTKPPLPQSSTRLQLPLSLLPTLPPLTFSSPTPFSLPHHSETKRYTQDRYVQPQQQQHHNPPPRIVISASASVSDNNGHRLNYSLGTIGTTQLLGSSPPTYDDYKEEDVILDPFYHDVPKLRSKSSGRKKRSVSEETNTSEEDEDEALDLLKFLFDLYRQKENAKMIKFPVPSEDIALINRELEPVTREQQTTTENPQLVKIAHKIANLRNKTKRARAAKAINLVVKDGGVSLKERSRVEANFETTTADYHVSTDESSTTTSDSSAAASEEFSTLAYSQDSIETTQQPANVDSKTAPVEDEEYEYDSKENVYIPDYVDDNYEPLTYHENRSNEEQKTTTFFDQI